MLSFPVLITNLVSLFLLMVVGFAIVRLKVLPAEMSAGLTSLLMKIVLPAMLFVSMQREFDKAFIRDGLIIIAVGFAMFFLFTLLSRPLSRLFKVPDVRRGSWMFGATYSNNGLMGFPIILSVPGDAGLALAVMLNIPQNICVYSMGAMQIRTASGGKGEKLNFVKAFVTPINVAILLGIIFYVFQLSVPEMIMKPLTYLNNMATPLPMLIIGMNLGAADLKSTLKDRDALTDALVRLIVFPVLMWALLNLLPISNPLIIRVVVLTVAMPIAAVAAPLSMQNGGDVLLASRAVLFSTIMCLVTIPLICLLP